MAEGIVKWFNEKRGFGFIARGNEAPDVLVHFSAIDIPGYKTLRDGELVAFDVKDSPQGPMTKNVRKYC